MIAAAQAEKEKTPPPLTETPSERVVDKIDRFLQPKSHSFFPYFDSVYSGGGFTLGAGYGCRTATTRASRYEACTPSRTTS